MADKNLLRRNRRLHEHQAVVTRTVRQHGGIPYEVEQRICSDCRRVLDERQLRRATS